MRGTALALLLAIGSTATSVGAGDTFAAKGLKAAIADCYATKDQAETDAVVSKKDWPGTLTCLATYRDRALFQIGSRQCWIERGELEIADLAGPKECDGGAGLYNRGLGDKDKCQPRRKR